MAVRDALREFLIREGMHGETPPGFDDDFDLIESGTLDSLLMMNLVTFLEQEHGVVFGMNDLVPRHFRSINTLAAFAEGRPAAVD